MRFCLKYVPITLLLASSSLIVQGVSDPSKDSAEIMSASDTDTNSSAGEDAAQTSSSEYSDVDAASQLRESTSSADMILPSVSEETALSSIDKETPPADMIPPSEVKETPSSSVEVETPPADMIPPSEVKETPSSTVEVEAPPADMIPQSEVNEAVSAASEESISPVTEDSETPSPDTVPAQTEKTSMSGTKVNGTSPVMAVSPQTPAPPAPAVQYEPQNTIISSIANVAGSLLNQKAARDNYAYQLARQQAEQKARQQNYAAARAADQVRLSQQAQIAQQEQYFRQNQMAQNAQLAMQGQLAQQSLLMQQQARMNNQYPSPVPYPAQTPYDSRYLAEEAAANANFQAEVALRERNRQKQMYPENAFRPLYETQNYYVGGEATQMQNRPIQQGQDFQGIVNETQKKDTSSEEVSEEDIEKQIAEAKTKLEAIKAKKARLATAADSKEKVSVDGNVITQVLPKTEKPEDMKSESNVESKKPTLNEKSSDASLSEKKSSTSIMNYSDKSVQKPSKKITTLGERELLKEKETLHFDEHGNPHVGDSENLEGTLNKENSPPSLAKKQVKMDEKKASPAKQKS